MGLNNLTKNQLASLFTKDELKKLIKNDTSILNKVNHIKLASLFTNDELKKLITNDTSKSKNAANMSKPNNRTNTRNSNNKTPCYGSVANAPDCKNNYYGYDTGR